MAQAPMSGVTDEAFRLMLLKYGKPDVFWTEFISVAALNSPKGRKYCLNTLKFNKKERPIVAQVFGGDPTQFEKAAKEIVEMGFDGIDINMGCPDRDIEKQGGGAILIKSPKMAKEIIRAVKRGAPGFPVSVKTRIGYDENQISEWIPALLEEKISALTVHFRTKKEMYLPSAHWELAKEIVKLRDLHAPETLILGNGDVKSLAEAHQLAKENGLDGIMIGRALLGDPWFFSGRSPTIAEKLNAIIEHAKLYKGEHFETLKKHFHAYTKGFRGAKDVREQLMKTKNINEVKKIIKDFL